MPIEVIVMPQEQALPRWWEHSCVSVRWEAKREPNSPVLTARGAITVERRLLDEDDKTEDYEPVKVGELVVATPALGDSCVALEMDALTGDHELLAGQICDGSFYNSAFADWFEETFGVMLAGDPVFVLDLKLDAELQGGAGVVPAHAVLDALAAFGSAHSPLVTFDESIVGESKRGQCRAEGLWSWIHPLRAQRWKDVYVACRPQH